METVRVLLISTYDLGRQPLGLASPAAWLRNEGVEVTCVDTSRDTLTDDQIGEGGPHRLLSSDAHGDTTGRPSHRTRRPRECVSRVCGGTGAYAPLNALVAPANKVSPFLGPDAGSRPWCELTQTPPNRAAPTPQPPRRGQGAAERLHVHRTRSLGAATAGSLRVAADA